MISLNHITTICRLNNISYIQFVVWSLFFCIFSSYVCADDIVYTIDGSRYSGKIISENKDTLVLEVPTGKVFIRKDKIKNVKLEQTWNIEPHVDRGKSSAKPSTVVSGETISLSGLTYFPIKSGNWWRYNVRYKPESLYGDPLPDKAKESSIVWRIDDVFPQPDIGAYHFRITSGMVGRLFSFEQDNDSQKKENILFIGAIKKNKKNSFLVMRKESENRQDEFFLRLLPLQPFLKENKRWIDKGIEGVSRFSSQSEIMGIEGVETEYGFFDNCLIVKRIDIVENQVLKSITYTWFAPHVGMVKMVQEIMFPQQDNDGSLTKSFILQEYEIINFEVK